jgi:hypothetical protein
LTRLGRAADRRELLVRRGPSSAGCGIHARREEAHDGCNCSNERMAREAAAEPHAPSFGYAVPNGIPHSGVVRISNRGGSCAGAERPGSKTFSHSRHRGRATAPNSPSGMGYRPSEDDDENQGGEKHGGGYAHHCTPELVTRVVPVHVAVDLSPATPAANLHPPAEFPSES